MGRLVRHDRNRPYEVRPEGAEKSVWICACGLSKNKPYCDGSHRRTRDEKEGVLYIYDDEGRIEVRAEY